MLVNRKTIFKLNRLLDIYNDQVFEPIETLDLESHTTLEHYRHCPDNTLEWSAIEAGKQWGEAWQTMWLKGSFTVPDHLKNQNLYLQAKTGAVEALLLVDGIHNGLFNKDSDHGVQGFHHTRLALRNCTAGSVHEVSLECYAGHAIVGVMPFDPREKTYNDSDQFNRTYEYVRVCRKRQYIMDFVTQLRILLQIAESSGSDSFRGASIYGILEELFLIMPQQPSDYSEKEIGKLIEKALNLMKPLLEQRSCGSAPYAAIIGHSHMDTAWLWTVDETKRKCARTFSNSLNLMDEYPDYMFLQSSPYHLEMMRKDYPEIFDRIKKRIDEGRWEPNGGSWIEPDCNIPSGESLSRHFLYGQKYLKEHFNYKADTFWQPDVFGYSASIPQVLKQCGIDYFLTTKLSWNEETRFPYDSFYWEGLDGSNVLTHFNTTHCWPDPKALISQTEDIQHKDIQHKDIQKERFCAFGYGDGGGPLFEMIETAPYLKDLDGVPRTEYSTVSNFMSGLEEENRKFPSWKGELYLELHRGTLTSFHDIKKMNRKVETLLREAEFLYSIHSMNNNAVEYPAELLELYWKVLLLNQFHDILPGTSIPEVNVKALEEMQKCQKDVMNLIGELGSGKRDKTYSVWNSLNWPRKIIWF